MGLGLGLGSGLGSGSGLDLGRCGAEAREEGTALPVARGAVHTVEGRLREVLRRGLLQHGVLARQRGEGLHAHMQMQMHMHMRMYMHSCMCMCRARACMEWPYLQRSEQRAQLAPMPCELLVAPGVRFPAHLLRVRLRVCGQGVVRICGQGRLRLRV